MGRLLFDDPIPSMFFKVVFINLGASSEEEALCNRVTFGEIKFKNYSFKEGGNFYPIAFPIAGNQPIATFKFFVTPSTKVFDWISRSGAYMRQHGPLNLLKPGHQMALDCKIFQYNDEDLTNPARTISLYKCLPQSYQPFETLNTMDNSLATERLSLYYFDFEIEEV
jgi:hypothetical protein